MMAPNPGSGSIFLLLIDDNTNVHKYCTQAIRSPAAGKIDRSSSQVSFVPPSMQGEEKQVRTVRRIASSKRTSLMHLSWNQ